MTTGLTNQKWLPLFRHFRVYRFRLTYHPSGRSSSPFCCRSYWLSDCGSEVLFLTFFRLPGKKLSPISFLLWIDQVIGLLFLFNISFGIVTVNLPYPARVTMGEGFCHNIRLPSNIYLTGSIVRSCLTAIYRVLFIRAQGGYSQKPIKQNSYLLSNFIKYFHMHYFWDRYLW